MKAFDYIEMRVPAKAQYVSVIRLTVSSLASRIGFTYDDIEDLKIATSEAVTNVVHHAYEVDEAGDIVIGCALYPNKLEIMVSDYGTSFDFESVKSQVGPYQGDENMAALREGGLGLYLMDALMDEVMLKNDSGVTVFMTKYVAREQVEQVGERITT